MSATLELFERWKVAKGLGSDRAAAAALGISHAGPAQWRAGRNGAASVIERMAKDLGIDPVPVILQAFAEAARDGADRRTLARLARDAGAACLALLVLLPFFPSRAEAHPDAIINHGETGLRVDAHPIHYANPTTRTSRIPTMAAVRAWCALFTSRVSQLCSSHPHAFSHANP